MRGTSIHRWIPITKDQLHGQCSVMITSSNWNVFHVTGHLCGEFTGQRWIFPHKGQWRGALMFSFICAWINGWVNNGESGDLRRHRDHYDVTVMVSGRRHDRRRAHCEIQTSNYHLEWYNLESNVTMRRKSNYTHTQWIPQMWFLFVLYCVFFILGTGQFVHIRYDTPTDFGAILQLYDFDNSL